LHGGQQVLCATTHPYHLPISQIHGSQIQPQRFGWPVVHAVWSVSSLRLLRLPKVTFVISTYALQSSPLNSLELCFQLEAIQCCHTVSHPLILFCFVFLLIHRYDITNAGEPYSWSYDWHFVVGGNLTRMTPCNITMPDPLTQPDDLQVSDLLFGLLISFIILNSIWLLSIFVMLHE
jgi:hypothetical protein